MLPVELLSAWDVCWGFEYVQINAVERYVILNIVVRQTSDSRCRTMTETVNHHTIEEVAETPRLHNTRAAKYLRTH